MTANLIKGRNGRSEVPETSFDGLVDQLFQNNLNRFFNNDLAGFRGVSRSTNVPINLQETDKSYEMQLVAPGLKKEDFKLNVHGDLLTVTFEHKEESNTQQENWLRQEYRMQSFTRSFNLDDTIDAGKIAASYKDGILHLTLPKKENAQKLSKNIEIL